MSAEQVRKLVFVDEIIYSKVYFKAESKSQL